MAAVMIGVMVVVMVVGVMGFGGRHGGTGSGHHATMERGYEYGGEGQKHPEPAALKNDLDVIRLHDRGADEREGLKEVSMMLNSDSHADEDYSKFDAEKESDGEGEEGSSC